MPTTASRDRAASAETDTELEAELEAAGETETEPEPDTGEAERRRREELEEEHDQAEHDQPETEPEPERAESSERAMRHALQALDRENIRHGNAVRKIMGSDAELLTECPLCDIPGYVFPFPAGTPHGEERRLTVEQYLGSGEPAYKEAPDAVMCAECDGLGEVLTSSRNPVHRLKVCAGCTGTGWVNKAASEAARAAQEYSRTAASPPPLTPGAPPELDAWGRPANHPHYGMAPAAVGA
jgi:hypothetical protein